MAGLYGFINLPLNECKDFNKKFFSFNFPSTVNEEFNYRNFIYGRSVLNKFTEDRFLYEDDEIIIGLDGILYGYDNTQYFFKNAYLKHGLDFIKDLKGNFSGFIFDKSTDQLHVFTDLLATRSIYYYEHGPANSFYFASELKVLTHLLKEQEIDITPDYDGFKCLLSLGYMLDDITLVKEIKRLSSSSTLTYSLKDSSIKINQFFNFNIEENEIALETAIEVVDQLLVNSIQDEWERDKKESGRALSFISGGLDARVNVMIAKELGYDNITCLNFSQTGADDHKIAKEIATGEDFNYIFYPLDKGEYFLDHFSEFVAANDGMVVLHGAAHMYQALKSINLNPYGAAHSGQIGGLLFGSFTRPNFNLDEDIGKIGFINDKKLLHEISILPEIIERNRHSLELFSYEQRQINGTLNGDRMCSHLIDLQSPFYNKELIKFCLSLPRSFKEYKFLYTEWIRTKHPNLFNYTWDKAGIVPKGRFYTKTAIKIKKWRGYVSRLLGNDAHTMNPFQNWMKENPELSAQLYDVLREELDLVHEEWLQSDIERIFRSYGINGKFAAVTALLAYKLHFK